MSILTKHGLLQHRNSARIYSKEIDESLTLFKTETKSNKIPVFILYEKDETEELDSLINFLKGLGILIYASWPDQSLQRDKSETTTQELQQQLEENHKIIFLATEKATQSKWCNWVLRFTANHKSEKDIAWFPIREDFSDYSSEELLAKHPYIDEIGIDEYHVMFPNGKDIALKDWLIS